MNRSVQLALAVTSSLLLQDVPAQTKHAVLEITVQKRVFLEEQPRSFQGVGLFGLSRGANKIEGASCPDHSGPTGKVRCTIPCTAKDGNPMVIRVKAPTDQDLLVGLVTPVAVDVEVRKCTIKPAKLVMLYEDAKQALDTLLARKFVASAQSQPGGTKPPASSWSWIGEVKRNPSTLQLVSASASSAEGRADLIAIHRYATLAAAAPALQEPDQSQQAKALADFLAQWQVLSKSALLEAKVAQVYPQKLWGSKTVSPTTDLASYRASLANADALIANSPSKSGDQLRLFDDIKTLKGMPSTGKDAVAANKVLESWKY
jgi:hypothetical protein